MKLLKIKISFVLFLFIYNVIFSQSDDYIDSLIVLVSKAKEDTNKLKLLSIIAENADDEIWPIYNNEMGKLAARLQKSPVPEIKLLAKKHLAAALNNKGFFFNERGIPYKAVLYFNKSLAIQREIGDKEGEAYSLSNLGAIYDSKGEIDKALEYYFAAVKIREKLNSKISLAQSYNNIAILYNHQNDLANSLKYHFQSLQIRKGINDPIGLALAYNNIGSTYTHLIETDYKGRKSIPDTLMNKSLEFFEKGYASYKQANNEYGIGLSLFNIGDHFILQADCFFKENSFQYDSLINKSENFFLQSLEIFSKLNEKEWIANTLNGLANIYYRKKNNIKAKNYAEKAMALAKELGYPGTIQNSSEILKKIYRANNEFEKALLMSDLFYTMRDSVVNDNNKKESLSKYFLYQNEKQQMIAKANHEKIELIFLAKSKQQSIILYFVVAGLIIIALFGLFMYNRFKVTQKQNKIIEKQKGIVEHQKHIAEESRKEIVDSINYAKRIQYALLASEDLLTRNLHEHFVLFKPKDIVSGDFYWATEHKDMFYLAVCDSTGHGVPGAFMSLLNIGFLSEAIKEKEISQPNEVFNYVRKRLIESISKDEQQDGMDGILLCIDKTANSITYSSANSSPILIRQNQVIELPKDKMPVGKGEKMESFKLHTINFQQNDNLYLYTDGYADQFGGPKGKKFKYKPLNEWLSINASLGLKEQSNILNQNFLDWKGDLEQVDDVLIVGIRL